MKVKGMIAYAEGRIGIAGAPTDVLECLVAYYVEAEGLPSLTAAERAEREAKLFVQKLSEHISDIEGQSNLPVLRVLDEISGRIAGRCWSGAGVSPEELVRNKCLACITQVIVEIQSLTANEFEDFCAAFLALLGATKTKVTPRSGDGGIDFYGWLHLGAFLPGDGGVAHLPDRVKFHFAGQAKHYPTSRLNPAVVRELVGAVVLARHGVGSYAQDSFEGLQFKALDPLVVLLITTGAFSRGARELARNSGIFPCDVGQVALYLSTRRVGFIVNGTEVEFSPVAFRSWIAHHANYEVTAPLDT
jgi:hypothetical protein